MVAVRNESSPKINVQEFSPRRVRSNIEATEPALVVLSQSFCHNWRAMVDNQSVPLLRADHAFQAVEVPAGRHELTLIYVDRLFQIGAGISD